MQEHVQARLQIFSVGPAGVGKRFRVTLLGLGFRDHGSGFTVIRGFLVEFAVCHQKRNCISVRLLCGVCGGFRGFTVLQGLAFGSEC